MVAIAQLVEHLIVVQKVARSSRVGHPSKTLPFAEGFCFFSLNSPLLGYRPNRHAGNHRVVHSGHIQFTEHKDKRSVMLSFENDYSRAAHPAVLEAVAEANNHLYSGYGSDELSDQAKAKIREACGQPDADVWFLVGGTQTNQVVIDTITPAYAGVVAVASGHPNVHEAGAIEFSGHKVLTIPQHNGKMDADRTGRVLQDLLCGRQLRAHGVPGLRVRLAKHRIWHHLLQGRVAGHRRCGAQVRHAAVRGWRATRLRADRHRFTT